MICLMNFATHLFSSYFDLLGSHSRRQDALDQVFQPRNRRGWMSNGNNFDAYDKLKTRNFTRLREIHEQVGPFPSFPEVFFFRQPSFCSPPPPDFIQYFRRPSYYGH